MASTRLGHLPILLQPLLWVAFIWGAQGIPNGICSSWEVKILRLTLFISSLLVKNIQVVKPTQVNDAEKNMYYTLSSQLILFLPLDFAFDIFCQMMLMMTLSLWYRRLPVLSCGNHNLWTLLTSFLSLGQLASHSQLAILRLALRGADLTRPQTDRVKFFYKDKFETRCILQYIFSDGQEPNTHKQKSTFSSWQRHFHKENTQR